MKKISAYTLTALVLLIPFLSFAQIVSPSTTKGWFTLQQKVEKNLSTNNQGMASISYNSIIFNFVNYNVKERSSMGYNTSSSSVVVRKLTNDNASSPHWNDQKIDNIKVFQELYPGSFQPAPVIFKDTLYLFVLNRAAQIAYSTYNSTKDTWSSLKVVATPNVFVGDPNYPDYNNIGMSAAVVGNNLCLVGSFNNTITIYWTDLKMTSWHTLPTTLQTYCNNYNNSYIDADSKSDNYNPGKYKAYPYISAIRSTFMDDNVQTEELMFGYINNGIHVAFAEYYFDSDNLLQFIKSSALTPALVADPNTYSSVALANGSVTGDPTSKGKCIQAFVKVYDIQNYESSFPIQRYEFKNGVWTQAENNLVVQNYGWAWPYSNLTVTNYSMSEDKDLRQFMCLLYQSKYGSDHPLNCAWAETDRLFWVDHAQKSMNTDTANWHYVGYIEGVPPYRVNDSIYRVTYYQHEEAAYVHGLGSDAISTASFGITHEEATSSDISLKVDFSTHFRASVLEAGAGVGLGKKYNTESSQTITNEDEYESTSDNACKGLYFIWYPLIGREHYKVLDTQKNIIDSIYYFYVMQIYKDKIFATMTGNLNSSQPRTYIDREELKTVQTDTNYTIFGTGQVTWAKGSSSHLGEISKKSTSKGSTGVVNIDVGYKKGKGKKKEGEKESDNFFQVGCSGDFEISSTTTTTDETEMQCIANMNEPTDMLDCTALNYNVYWLQSIANKDAWWLPKTRVEGEVTWCITYDVYKYTLKNGTTYDPGNPKRPDITLDANPGITPDVVTPGNSIKEIIPAQSSLAQNAPNPFNRITKINYQVADEKLPSNAQGYVTKLVIYNLSGQQVATLVNENKAPGSYEVEWDASQFTPGVYFYSLQSGSFKDVKKLILLK